MGIDLPPVGNAGLGRELDRLRALVDLSEKALQEPDSRLLLSAACSVTKVNLGLGKVGVFELTSGRAPGLILRSGVGWSPESVGKLAISGRVSVDKAVARSGDPGLSSGIANLLHAAGESCALVASISRQGTPYGVVAGFPKAAQAKFGGSETHFIQGVANIVGASLGRAKVELSLRSSEQRLSLAQRIAHMGSYDWDITADTNIWSDELYRIYGTEPQSFNASYEKFLSFIHPDDRERIIAVHKKAYETGEPYEMDERIIRPDGEVRILESNGEVIADESGRPVRMVGICFDVTEQREAFEQAQQFRESLTAKRQALDINDGVVQGLACALLALQEGRSDLALEVTRATLDTARQIMTDLLGKADVPPAAGSLVRAHSPKSALTREEASAPPARQGSIRLLVADDSEDMRMLLTMTLAGDTRLSVVAEACDGIDAVAKVEDERPDAILLDLAMPRMDGLEAIDLIRARSPETTIIVLSGFDQQRMRPLAIEHGAHEYVEKGSSLIGLCDVIVAACRRSVDASVNAAN